MPCPPSDPGTKAATAADATLTSASMSIGRPEMASKTTGTPCCSLILCTNAKSAGLGMAWTSPENSEYGTSPTTTSAASASWQSPVGRNNSWPSRPTPQARAVRPCQTVIMRVFRGPSLPCQVSVHPPACMPGLSAAVPATQMRCFFNDNGRMFCLFSRTTTLSAAACFATLRWAARPKRLALFRSNGCAITPLVYLAHSTRRAASCTRL
mmetsp:Transcript_15487/g.42759  ORF Transcript_15487/g.42759 Transcript_15487/m.42759 type:complete len:210 (+) Transcript_15487:202-831(+)